MGKLIPFLVLLLTFSSCGLLKEARQTNRASRLIEKAKRIDPKMVSVRTEEKTLHIPVQTVQGRFSAPVELPEVLVRSQEFSLNPPTELSPTTDLSFHFEDSSISALIRIHKDSLFLDYELKASTIEFTYTDTTDVLNPVRIEKAPLWHRLFGSVQVLFWILLALFLGFAIGKFLR